jgi:hypothetical protein
LGGNSSLDLIHDGRLSECAEIPQVIAFPCDDLAHDTAHNLARPGLGKVGDDIDPLGRREGADHFADLECELLGQTRLIIRVVFELAEKKEKKSLRSK